MKLNDVKKLNLKEGDYIKLIIDIYGEMFKYISKVQSYDNTNGIIVEEYSVCQTSTDKDIEGDISYGDEIILEDIYDSATISKANEKEIEYLEEIIKEDRFE